jgi:hypothetical protein
MSSVRRSDSFSQIFDAIRVKPTPQTDLFRRALLGTVLVCSLPAALAVCSPTQAPNPATVATDRLQFSWWADRHKAVVEAAHSHPDKQLLLIGDSIINRRQAASAR